MLHIDFGALPWEPAKGARIKESWHFWDYPRWGYFEIEGVLVAFHRHENINACDEGSSLWTYRVLDDEGLAGLSLPAEQWGEPWRRAYTAWRASSPAQWWVVANDEIRIVRWGVLDPVVIDDAAWADAFAREQGIEKPAEEEED